VTEIAGIAFRETDLRLAIRVGTVCEMGGAKLWLLSNVRCFCKRHPCLPVSSAQGAADQINIFAKSFG
jgi:hypothetical protein